MEITVNVTGLDNLANAIFALAKAAGNCKQGTQVNATKVAPVVQQTVVPTETVAPAATTVQARHQYSLYQQRPWHKMQHLRLTQCQQPQQRLHIQWNSWQSQRQV